MTTQEVTTARTRPDRLSLAGLGIVAVAAAATSFSTLAELAREAGWSREVSPALPVIIDAMALVSTRTWLSGPAAVRALARRTAVLCILASVAGNAVAQLIAAGVIRPSVALVIVVAMVPPVGLGVVAHLAAALSAAGAAGPVTAAQELPERVLSPTAVDSVPAPAADAAPDITADNVPDTTRTRRRPDTALRVARLAAKHPDTSAAAMAAKLGVSDRTVRRHLAALAAA